MSKSSLVLYQGAAFTDQGSKRFTKDVLRVGKWIHPITKQVVEITPSRIRNLVKNTEAYRQTLDRKAVPFQDGHNFDAKKTLGWWNRFWVDGDRLVGEVEVTDSEAAKKIEERSIRSVSARIDPNVNDTKGGVFDEAFTHVCATPLAVLDGQQDFQQLSREADPVELYIELSGILPVKENAMEMKQIAVLLGLPETAKPEEIGEAAKKAVGAQATALDQVKAEQSRIAVLSASLKEHGLEAKDGKAVKLAAPPAHEETPREKEMRIRAEKAEAVVALSRAQSASVQAAEFVKAGKVPPALQISLSRLLAVEGKQKALLLSKDGAGVEEMVDVVNEALALVKGLPSLTTEQLSQGQGDEEKKKAEALDKEVDDVVKLVQPTASKE